jgi:hypothetical protein
MRSPSPIEPCQECLHQRRLPDPRFPGDEDGLPSSTARRLEQGLQACQLGVASNQWRLVDLGRTARRNSAARRPDGADEAESPPMDRLDVARRARRIGQRAAQVAYAAREGGLTDDRVAPRGGEQVVLRDELLGMLDEVAQDRERLRREVQRSFATPRPLALEVDANRGTIAGAPLAHRDPSVCPE